MKTKEVNFNKYVNFRAELLELHWNVYATNTRTGKEEKVRTFLRRSSAYSYITKMEYRNKHTIHSNRLRVVLALKKVSYQTLSKLTGLSKSTISGYVTNRIQPSYGTLHLIAEALKVKPEELINF